MNLHRTLLHRPFFVDLSKTVVVSSAIAIFSTTALAQDPIEDRLSPGNGADWAGELQEEVDDDNDSTSASNQPRLTPPGPDQAWYRRSDGRFFYRDQDGNEIFEEQVYGPRTRRNTGQAYSVSNRPMLGVALQDTTDGFQVTNVIPGSPAQQAGIQAGDIVNRYNDRDATTSQDFVNRVAQMSPGDRLSLQVTRNGQSQQLNATLGATTIQEEVYRAARPMLTPMLNGLNRGNQMNELNRFRRDIDQLRRDFDVMSQRLDDFVGGSAAKQKADE